MSNVPFSLNEFIISQPKNVTVTVADKIYKYHIIPMLAVREEMNITMTASQKSGYRPEWWEKKKGRSGNSQHTFKDKGAVDWTCHDFKNNQDAFLSAIIEHTNYTRMATYNSFIHCDYKSTPSGKREVYSSTPSSKWTFVKYAS